MRALSSLVLFGHGYATGITDEITLLQGYAPKKSMQEEGVHDKKAISSLLETAQNMLKNGATPDVSEFAQATLEEITGVVVPAIENASASDQAWVYATFAQFEVILTELEMGTASVNRLNALERSHSTAHKACRDVEHDKCTTKVTCDYDLYSLWNVFVEEETALRLIQTTITGHFCPPDANGTLQIFRDTSVPHMHAFIHQKGVVEVSAEHYIGRVPDCELHYAQLDQQTEVCDAHQTSLEEAACAHAVEVRRVREKFTRDWQDAVAIYESVVAEVRLLVIDRIREFRTLSTIQCLLDRTTERNGRPCDESTGEVDEEITHCEHVRDTVDITWLLLEYPEIPPIPPPCPDRDQVQGRCIPEPPNYPCSAGFIQQEYSMLPAVPQPQFHHENSHCNQRPECQRCIAMEEPSPPTLPPIAPVVPVPDDDDHELMD